MNKKTYYTKFGLDVGWFSGESFSLLEIVFFDKTSNLLTLFSIKIAKFVIVFYVDI